MTDGSVDGSVDRSTDRSAASSADGPTDRQTGWVPIVRRAIRGLLLATGIAVFVVGLLVVLIPGTEDLIPVDSAVALLGSDYVVVAIIGALSVGLALLVVTARHLRGFDEATPPAVEGVQSATYPGRRFDQPDRGLVSRWVGDRGDAERRERLEEAAVRATMRAGGRSRGDAEQLVAEGDWTDDPAVARYLSRSGHANGRGGARDGVGGASDRVARRTVDAIERLTAGGSEPSRSGPSVAKGARRVSDENGHRPPTDEGGIR